MDRCGEHKPPIFGDCPQSPCEVIVLFDGSSIDVLSQTISVRSTPVHIVASPGMPEDHVIVLERTYIDELDNCGQTQCPQMPWSEMPCGGCKCCEDNDCDELGVASLFNLKDPNCNFNYRIQNDLWLTERGDYRLRYIAGTPGSVTVYAIEDCLRKNPPENRCPPVCNTKILTLHLDAEIDATITVVTGDGLDYQIDWGDGPAETVASGSSNNHIYASPYTGDVSIIYDDCRTLIELHINGRFDDNLELVSAQTTDLLKFTAEGGNITSGNIEIIAQNWSKLTSFRWRGDNIGTGDLGIAASSWTDMVLFWWDGNSTGTGDITVIASNWPSLTLFHWAGLSTGVGDLAVAASSWPLLTSFVWGGNSTGTGDITVIASNWPGLTIFNWGGVNTGSGDVAIAASSWPLLTSFRWDGNNVGTGDIIVIASNWPSLTLFHWTGLNAGSGDLGIAASSWPLLVTFRWDGNNVGAGDITVIASNWPLLKTFTWGGLNTGGGDLLIAASNWPVLLLIAWGGNNTGTGDIAIIIPTFPNITNFDWEGFNAGTVSASFIMPTTFGIFIVHGAAKSTAEVDFMLNAGTVITTWLSPNLFDVAGLNQPAGASGISDGGIILSNGATAVNYN